MRQFIALLVFLFAAIVAANPLDDAIAMMKRQNDGNSTSSTPTSSGRATGPTTLDTTSTVTPTSSRSVSTVLSTSTFTPTNSAGSTVTTETSTFTSRSSASRTLVTTSATHEVLTTFTTVSDGSTLVGTRTSSTVVPTTTAVDPATLNGGNGSGGSTGLSSTAKKTIGGVVGGVGGALLLAGLAYTAWRVWGKKKNLHDDDLYDPNHYQEKLSTSTDTASTPFRSNLEQYHQPGPVNTASNF